MIEKVEWRQPGKNYDPDLASLESAFVPDGTSLTIQSAAPETEINAIVRRYGLTGEMPVRRQLAEYGDFDESMDFQTMLQTLHAAEYAFGQVPADIRARFDNDAGAFMEWINAPANHKEAVELGLLDAESVGIERPAVVVPSKPSDAVVQAAAVKAADAGAGAGAAAV